MSSVDNFLSGRWLTNEPELLCKGRGRVEEANGQEIACNPWRPPVNLAHMVGFLFVVGLIVVIVVASRRRQARREYRTLESRSGGHSTADTSHASNSGSDAWPLWTWPLWTWPLWQGLSFSASDDHDHRHHGDGGDWSGSSWGSDAGDSGGGGDGGGGGD